MDPSVLTDPWWLAASAGAIALPCLAPAVLARRKWHLNRPVLALSAWIGTLLLGCTLPLYSIGAVIAAAARQQPSDQLWPSVAVTLVAWLCLGAAGIGASLILANAEPLSLSRQARLGALAPLATARLQHNGYTLVHFDSPEPIALAGCSAAREIFLSSELTRTLSGPELDAVIAHEKAHLRQRHGLILRIAEINAACLPRAARVGREFKRATRLLVELIADDSAAREVGPARYANTLVRMGHLTGDPMFPLRAKRLASRNWRRRWPALARQAFFARLRLLRNYLM